MDIGGDGIGKYSEGVNLPGLEALFALASMGALSSSVPESLRWVYLFPANRCKVVSTVLSHVSNIDLVLEE